jgi:hypothetical protein
VKRTFVAVAVTVTAAFGGAVASAAWLSPSGAGSARAAAASVGAGNAPSVNANGSSVTVAWSASALAGGYVVRRYNALDVAQTIGADCSGAITALTCTEAGVAAGTWKYSVTPVQSNWTGTESAKTSVTVAPVVTDTTAPAATITFPADNGTYNGTSFNAGCAANPSNVCGTASDATGVGTVKVSIRQGTGNYWNGTSFGSAAEVLNTATLTSPNATSTDWRLPLSLPADGSYTIRVQTVDTATPANTQTPGTYAATSAFTYDNTAATLAISQLAVASNKTVSAIGTSNLPLNTTFSVVLCKVSSFPCSTATPNNVAATLTATVNDANGNWTSSSSGNLNNVQVWGRATHTDAAGNTGASAVAGPVTP